MVEVKAIIYDLDNTIYPVSSIAPKLFPPLFRMLEEEGIKGEDLTVVKDQVMRIPFQKVAAIHGFSPELKEKGILILRELTISDGIRTFPDYPVILRLPGKRFLVTSGFPGLQWSKIRGMGIEDDFLEIYIVDPSNSQKTKKDVFIEILNKHQYPIEQVLVVGDDPESEIRAAEELGIVAVLYDKEGRYPEATTRYHISDYTELEKIIGEIKT